MVLAFWVLLASGWSVLLPRAAATLLIESVVGAADTLLIESVVGAADCRGAVCDDI
jgi:hypothetical protein